VSARLLSGMAAKIHTDHEEHIQVKSAPMIEALESKRNRPRDVEALHHMQAARPLKPPPYDFGPRRSRVGVLAARQDRKLGILV
jgi:hypothetical protein